MRFVRYQYRSEEPTYGWLHEEKVGPLEGEPFSEFRRLEAVLPLTDVKLLPPLFPGKIIGIGSNFLDRTEEGSSTPPEMPLLFLKPPTTVIGPAEKIVLPPQSRLVEHEIELGIVIGRRGRWIHADQAQEYVLGYVIANDITARDLLPRDGQWTRAKGFDTFCPLGPWIETELDPADVLMTCRVNNELRQMASTREMIFTVAQLVAFVSSVMTLQPGDLILSGSPPGSGPLLPGDEVFLDIEGIGDLSNPVIAEASQQD